MSAKLGKNQVYLRNTVTGRVYPYERNLAGMSNMEQFSTDDHGKPLAARKVAEETVSEKRSTIDKRAAELDAREADLNAREADLANRESVMRQAEVRGTNGSVEQQDLDSEKDTSTANKLAEAQTPVDDNKKNVPTPPKKNK